VRAHIGCVLTVGDCLAFLNALRPSKSVHKSEKSGQYIDPDGSPILACRKVESLSIVLSGDFQKLKWIIGDNPVDLFHDTPLHPFFVIDSPQEYRAFGSFKILEEFVAHRSNHAFLKHVEVHSWFLQELPSIYYAESNMSCAIIRKIFRAQREIAWLVDSQLRSWHIASSQVLTIQKPSKIRSLHGRDGFPSFNVFAINLITSSALLSVYCDVNTPGFAPS